MKCYGCTVLFFEIISRTQRLRGTDCGQVSAPEGAGLCYTNPQTTTHDFSAIQRGFGSIGE